MIYSILNLITKIRFKRTAKQRYKAYNKLHQTPYGIPSRNESYYE